LKPKNLAQTSKKSGAKLPNTSFIMRDRAAQTVRYFMDWRLMNFSCRMSKQTGWELWKIQSAQPRWPHSQKNPKKLRGGQMPRQTAEPLFHLAKTIPRRREDTRLFLGLACSLIQYEAK
jgi:hypothetical protein